MDVLIISFCASLIGTIISILFFNNGKNYKKLFQTIWLIGSAVFVTVTICVFLLENGIQWMELLTIVIISPIYTILPSVLFSVILFLLLLKQPEKKSNLAASLSNPVIVSLILLIPILLFFMFLHTENYQDTKTQMESEKIVIIHPTPKTGELPVISENQNSTEMAIQKFTPTKTEGNHNGELITMGRYVLGTDGKVSPLQWYIISSEDQKTTLITKDVIARGPYDYRDNLVPFQQSFIYNWLNEYFRNDAFSWKIWGCTYSFRLLTETEAIAIKSYIPLTAQATLYAFSTGPFYDQKGNSVFWLTQSPAYDNYHLITISSDGIINQNGVAPNTGCGIRPVIEIDCSLEDFLR